MRKAKGLFLLLASLLVVVGVSWAGTVYCRREVKAAEEKTADARQVMLREYALLHFGGEGGKENLIEECVAPGQRPKSFRAPADLGWFVCSASRMGEKETPSSERWAVRVAAFSSQWAALAMATELDWAKSRGLADPLLAFVKIELPYAKK